MSDQQRIDQIIIFSLLEADQEDDPWDRELGPIHLVKYVYLADLAYSEYHNGETFTRAPWRFYHFGPWSEDVYYRINPVLEAIGANIKPISSPKVQDDFYRYSYSDDEHYNEVLNSLPFEITGPLKKAIHSYGKDTSELLHYVYRTRPMICAAPGEYLCFTPKEQVEEMEEEKGQDEKFSVKRKNLKKAAIEKLKKEMAARLKKTLAQKKGKKEFTPPRYDEIYNEGIKWIEDLAGDPIKKEEGILEVSPDFWRSKFRTDDELY
jgi:hypothetical protein